MIYNIHHSDKKKEHLRLLYLRYLVIIWLFLGTMHYVHMYTYQNLLYQFYCLFTFCSAVLHNIRGDDWLHVYCLQGDEYSTCLFLLSFALSWLLLLLLFTIKNTIMMLCDVTLCCIQENTVDNVQAIVY